MIKRIFAICFVCAVLFSFMGSTKETSSQTRLTSTLYGTTVDTINNSNAADTSRTFNVPAGITVNTLYMYYYKSSNSVWREVKVISPLVSLITQFRISYSQADSTVTVEGKLHGYWVQLPVKSYGTVSRTVSMTGGGTAWVGFDGYAWKEDE